MRQVEMHPGGIYLDSDVNVFRKFDVFLHHAGFSSVEYIPKHIPLRNEKNEYCGYAILSAVIGADKGNGWIKKCLDHYRQEKEFKVLEGGKVDVEVIPDVLARYAHLYYGFQYDQPLDQPQYLKENIVIYHLKYSQPHTEKPICIHMQYMSEMAHGRMTSQNYNVKQKYK